MEVFEGRLQHLVKFGDSLPPAVDGKATLNHSEDTSPPLIRRDLLRSHQVAVPFLCCQFVKFTNSEVIKCHSEMY